MLSKLKHNLPAIILFVFFSSLYIYTAAPSIYSGDTGEITAAVNTLGLAHSTGFPLYMISGKIFTLIIPWGDIAFRLNIYSALLTAGAVTFLFLLLRSLNISMIPAVLASTIFGLGRNTIWANAGTANVYALTLFLAVILFNIFIKWHKTRKKKYIYWYAFLWGVSLGTHVLISVMAIPLLFILWSELKRKHIKTIIYSALLSILPLFQYIYLWFAYKRNAVITFGDISNFHAFISYITQRDWAYKIAYRIPDSGDISLFINTLFKLLSSEFSIIFFLAIIIGFVILGKQNKQFLLFILSLALGNILIMFFYGDNRDLVILQRYFFLVYAVFAVVLAYLLNLLFKKCNSLKTKLLFLTFVFFVIGLQFKYAFADNNRHDHFIISDFGENILNSMPSDSLIFVDGDAAWGSLLYRQSLNVRNDVVVVPIALLQFDWYIKNESLKYPEVVSTNLISLTTPSDRINEMLRNNVQKRNIYTIFPSWEGKSSDFGTVPIGILYQVVERGTSVKDILDSSRQWQSYEMRGIKVNYYKDEYLNNMANNYRLLLNDTARAYYEVGYFDEAEYLLQKASDIGSHQVLENNLNRIIKSKSDKE